jgi:hypothetical protein
VLQSLPPSEMKSLDGSTKRSPLQSRQTDFELDPSPMCRLAAPSYAARRGPGHCALGQHGVDNVRFGSKADITFRSDECRFTSESRCGKPRAAAYNRHTARCWTCAYPAA